jgi:SAM-dependent methyltransferase
LLKTDLRNNFDSIARCTDPSAWNHNNHYHSFLLRHLPEKRKLAYDIGCGLGVFTAQLAEYFEDVVGVDYAPAAIQRARSSSSRSNVTYLPEDFTEIDFPAETVDLFASIATLHHLPFELSLQKMKDALKPGGRILILDLYQAAIIGDYFTLAIASVLNRVRKALRSGAVNNEEEIARLWRNHARFDVYKTLNEISRISRSLLPGARLERHLYWRYSMIWEEP